MSYRVGPMAIQKPEVQIFHCQPFGNEDYETIERKGVGHPDTIADILAQKISREYARYTTKYCSGVILHHQIDKLMVIGGKTETTFGNGKFIFPIKIIVAGRASYMFGGILIPVEKIVRKVIYSHFREYFPLVPRKFIVIENLLTNHAGPGTIRQSKGAIAKMFSPDRVETVRGYEKYVANDTSYCVAYAPLSALERSILEAEKYLNSKDTKKLYPWLGSDIKIMAVRNFSKVSITMCIPLIAKYVKSFDEYKKYLNKIARLVNKKFVSALPEYDVEISINTKDDYEKMNVYLTVSGASLSGDIGVVGRGNRTNGLITSNRPMSMEGTNGKNPRYYSGFIYANLTKIIANRIYSETEQPCVVEMVAQNGGLLKEPWRTRVVTKADETIVKKIVSEEVSKTEKVTQDFLEREFQNC